jgi:hypothetical protein
MHALRLGARGNEAIEGNRLRARGMALFTVVVDDRAQAAANASRRARMSGSLLS